MKEMRGLLFVLFLALAAKPAQAVTWGLNAGTHIGFGSFGHDAEDAYESRTVATLDLQALPGARFFGTMLLAGLLTDFRVMSQLSDMDKATRGDFSGKGLLIGPGAMLDLSMGRLILAWDLRARASVSQPEDTTFKGSGFHMIFSYVVMGKLGVEFEFVKTTYSTVSNSREETAIPGEPLRQKTFGLGVSTVF